MKTDPSQVQKSTTGSEGRSLPFSEDGEKGVICSLLLSPRTVLDLCQIQLRPEAFYVPAHQAVYNLVAELGDANKPIDFITLKQALKDRGQLDEIGGHEYLSDLFSFVPSSANAEYYIDIIREKYILRQMIVTCSRVISECYDNPEEVDSLLDTVEQQIFSITNHNIQTDVRPTKQLVMDAIEEIEQLYENRGSITGLPSGFAEFDRMTSGFHSAEMIVIAARPSMGKTAFAMNIAEHVAINAGKAVAVFSLEMSSSQLVQRLLCSRAKVNLQKLRNGFLSDRDFPLLTSAAAQLSESHLLIDDTAGLSISELRAKARRMKSQHDIKLIVIDYLQLLRGSSRRSQDNRQLEISEISGGVKALAKELNIPIIVIAQLNRQPDLRGTGKPRLSDLRESGSIEQDADVVGLLVRAEYYETDEEAKQDVAGEAELIIAKQRNGPVGEVPLVFLKEFTRFESRAKIEARS
jgi:replicative DNA helicase